MLSDVIDKALVFCEHEFAGIEVERHLPPLPAIRGVAGSLTQVFVNLFTNAAHAMGESGGRLQLSARVDSESHAVLFHVADQGLGSNTRASL